MEPECSNVNHEGEVEATYTEGVTFTITADGQNQEFPEEGELSSEEETEVTFSAESQASQDTEPESSNNNANVIFVQERQRLHEEKMEEFNSPENK